MNFQKFKNNSYCVGQKHYSGTKNIVGEMKYKKTGRENKLLVGQCSICNGKKSLTMSNNTIEFEGLGESFKSLGKKRLILSNKMAKNSLKNPGRALEIGANVGTAFACRSTKSTLSSLPEVINFYHTGKGLYLWKVCLILCHLNGTKNNTVISICTFNELRPRFRTNIRKKIK